MIERVRDFLYYISALGFFAVLLFIIMRACYFLFVGEQLASEVAKLTLAIVCLSVTIVVMFIKAYNSTKNVEFHSYDVKTKKWRRVR